MKTIFVRAAAAAFLLALAGLAAAADPEPADTKTTIKDDARSAGHTVADKSKEVGHTQSPTSRASSATRSPTSPNR